ncbi:multiple inositol polyphosphate phosphatase-related [Holotrichia oblita]|uniref:Multiple inositol polyphosphate phosphatase-related n=1 Tax=Holotrichia oblita TaxID=644536 RepID=A0ACB9SNE7_HOLOL|nr:multiple inositol polyphosphate phosphatase-related [Holotrichia oblita]
MKVCTLAILFGIFAFANSAEDRNSIFSYLATKSGYRFAANLDINDVSQEEGACPQKVWMFLRHGTRNPSKGDINNMNGRLLEIKNIVLETNRNVIRSLDSTQLDQLENWSPAVTDIAYQQILTAEGKLENEEISQRMQARFPTLFPSTFDNSTYWIMHTDSDRTRDSATHFAIGLFGNDQLDEVYFPEPTYEDLKTLEFYELCTKWIEDIEGNPESLIERDLFEASAIVQNAVDSVNRAVGLTNELSLKDVMIMYKTCSFESSWFRNSSSPWCMAFDLDSIRVIAYAEDLEYYWVDGYGFELNYKQTCPAIIDVVNFFEDDESDRKTTIYFTHSGAVIKLIARLGLYFDEEPLLHTTFNPEDPKYWQISKVGSFLTNVALILHDCGDSKMISVRHNERLVRLPACPDSDLCDFETFKAYFDDSINNCNFEEMCGLLK